MYNYTRSYANANVVSHVMRNTIKIIALILILTSCNYSNQNKPINSIDSTKLIFQKKKESFTAALANSMNLPSLNKGVDSFELRLWVSSMFVDQDIIDLSFKNGCWEPRKYKYRSIADSVTFFEGYEIQSSIDLPDFICSLKEVDFANLKSQDEIDGFIDKVADGVTYNLEVATKKTYKLYSYHCPEFFSKTEVNNRKFLDIILLLDKFFNFWRPICVN